MAWYRTGTVAVTNGSTTVTGTGTAFVGAVERGDGFVGPDGRSYEIATVVSATQITLAGAYLGSTQSGAEYAVFPTQSRVIEQAAALDALISSYQGVYDTTGQGRFPDGSAAAPGIRFAADEDTGFTRPAANQIGLVAGGTRRALLSSAALEINVPVTGTAAQANSTDTTPGRLFKMNGSTGCFGLGAQGAIISDFSTLPAYSQFLSGGGGGTTDGPPDSGAFRPGIACYRASSDRLAALMFTTGGAAVRNYTAGVAETGWNTIFAQRNILGAVSQSAGVPTGAVIESGSNANGRYVRWADGTQICTNDNAAITTAPAAFTGTITKIDGDKLWLGRWF